MKPACLLLVLAVLCAGRMPLRSAEVTVQINQGGSHAILNYTITNNDPGAVYNSASVSLGPVFQNLIDGIVANKLDPTTGTLQFSNSQQVYQYIATETNGINLSSSGDVHFGWSSVFDTASKTLTLGHVVSDRPDRDYTTWQNSYWNSSQDTLTFSAYFGDLLDFNNDQVLDRNEEMVNLVDSPAGVFAAQEGITSYTAPVPRVVVRGPWRERGAESARMEAQVGSGGDLVLTWRALHGLSYTVETATDLSSDPLDWTELATYQRPATPGEEWQAMTHTATAAVVPGTVPARRFYRLRVEMP